MNQNRQSNSKQIQKSEIQKWNWENRKRVMYIKQDVKIQNGLVLYTDLLTIIRNDIYWLSICGLNVPQIGSEIVTYKVKSDIGEGSLWWRDEWSMYLDVSQVWLCKHHLCFSIGLILKCMHSQKTPKDRMQALITTSMCKINLLCPAMCHLKNCIEWI